MTATKARLVAMLLPLAMAGCDGRASDPTTGDLQRGENTVLTVSVAASTKDAMEQVAALFERETGTTVRINSGPTSALAGQIIAGAPADILLSASYQWADAVTEKGLARDSKPLLTNSLVLIVPRGNPAGVHSPDGLRSPRVAKVALAGESVPAGIYAVRALEALACRQDLAAAGKIVLGHDVRTTLTYVERGEAEAGIVYSTDASTTGQVEVVYTFDPSTHGEIVYPVVLLKDGGNEPAARRFYDFLSSDAAQRVMQQFGFTRFNP